MVMESLRVSASSWVVSFFVLAAGITVPAQAQDDSTWTVNGITVGQSVKNDVSPPLRELLEAPVMLQPLHLQREPLAEIGRVEMYDYDPVVQDYLAPEAMPAPILNFDGIPFPGVSCNCAPPDTNGEVGATQYVQMVNEGLQVFNKATGASVLGPIAITTLWSGFGGVCELNGSGDPVVLYDQLASRWVVTQFAGVSVPTDECVAVSTTSDASGTWFRYDFNLGTNFFDYPKLSVWPDAYYLSENVFNTAGTAYLGPQPFALDRAAMLVGAPATFVTPGLQSTTLGSLLPADLDGAVLPPAGAPNPWLSADGATWWVYRFHVDFATPANTTWTLGGSLTPAGFTTLCSGTRSCVPQLGTTAGLDGLGDRPMFRLAYRRFADGHEALLSNRSVSVGGVAGIRWWEINNATSGVPGFVQQSTYQPDTTWRWLGSIAMDVTGNLALGFSASSSTINPQLRYAGRLAGDPAGTLAQGEATLFAGTGSQTGTGNRWGDYSALTVDPVDDCTFWYTNEYYSATTSFNWKTRIGSFKFPGCSLSPTFTLAATPASQAVCVPDEGLFTVNVGSISGFTNAVTLSATGNPAGTTVGFAPNPVPPPGASTFTVGNTGAAAPGTYAISIQGSASGSSAHSTGVELSIFNASPAAPALTAPANGALNVVVRPVFTWTGAALSYLLEVDNDSNFSSPVYSATVAGTTHTPGADLPSNTHLFWRVTASNPCGSTPSSVFAFTTVALPGDCAVGSTPNILYQYGFEAGVGGWAHSGTGDSWAIVATNPHSGTAQFHATDPTIVSDQRLVSPAVVLPTGQNPVVLKFWHLPNLENSGTTACFDGGILEVSTDGGTVWTQEPNANLLVGPYTGLVSASFANPLANLPAWCNGTVYIQTIADVSAYAGLTAQFRLRLGSDNSVGDAGWDVDDVVVQACQPDLLFTLDVTVAGSGTVTSVPAGINCPGDCTENYLDGTPVALTPAASGGWQFTGWSGACTGTGACNVTMSQARAVTATFTQLFTLNVTVSGGGTVTSVPAGINCPGDCTENYLDGTPVALTPAATAGWQFTGWSGACTGTGACNVSMTQARAVTATFDTMPFLDGFESGNTSHWSLTLP